MITSRQYHDTRQQRGRWGLKFQKVTSFKYLGVSMNDNNNAHEGYTKGEAILGYHRSPMQHGPEEDKTENIQTKENS